MKTCFERVRSRVDAIDGKHFIKHEKLESERGPCRWTTDNRQKKLPSLKLNFGTHIYLTQPFKIMKTRCGELQYTMGFEL